MQVLFTELGLHLDQTFWRLVLECLWWPLETSSVLLPLNDSQRLKHLSAADADLGVLHSATLLPRSSEVKRSRARIVVVDIDVEVDADGLVSALAQLGVLAHPLRQVLVVRASGVCVHELYLVLRGETPARWREVLFVHHHLERVSVRVLSERSLELLRDLLWRLRAEEPLVSW